jgi:SAM-dependent methyltransferase
MMHNATSTFAAASGEGYELLMGRWSRRLAGPFLDFAGLTDGGRILDAGCGTGALSAELLRRTERATIVGVDISVPYIDYARSSQASPRLRFESGDMARLGFAEGTFDQVYSQLALQFVTDPAGVVGELVRVARPGGTIAAAVWDARGGLTLTRMFLDTAAMLDPAADDLRKRNFTRPLSRPGELAAAWRAAGLVERRSGEVTVRTEFECFDDYWMPFDGEDGPVPTYLRSTSESIRKRIKAAVRRAYLDGERDGPRSYTATTWVVTGRKPAA